MIKKTKPDKSTKTSLSTLQELKEIEQEINNALDAIQLLENSIKDRTAHLKKSLKLVKYQATHDFLAGLPNQLLLVEQIKLAIEKAKQSAFRKLEIESHLHVAIKNNELRLLYQPFIDLKSGKICGMEALVYWKNPVLGLVSPAEFIPLAEANGMIVPLGEWVFRNACAQIKLWHEQGFTHLKLAINLSAKQLHQKNIVKMIATILEEVNLDAEHIELELTETEAFKEDVIPVVEELKALGFDLSIDDFGTGHSGLKNLKTFSIDKLKIDKSFVQDIDHNEHSQIIAENIIALAKKMHIHVLAEGVETEAQLKFLTDHGCDMIQGYYFSPPLSPDEFTELLMSE